MSDSALILPPSGPQLTFVNSIVQQGSVVSLDGDQDLAISKIYGADANGMKQWLPSLANMAAWGLFTPNPILAGTTFPGRMLGLGVSQGGASPPVPAVFTATRTGRVFFWVNASSFSSNTAGTSVAAGLRCGTGVPPANNAAATGNAPGAGGTMGATIPTANYNCAQTVCGWGVFQIGTPTWIDLAAWVSGSGTGILQSLMVGLIEF